ncbi:NADPH:quinone reductase-like Zn-dependent oxidoreductase [Chitinophaga niastensis]|uniref:NADPH:quinone reductase-like Zn-dependent oxidoreductase n=1 Tax=Chitinophaga niastensis TaxID=536980 RepID=A0A2P8HUJ5_CHINA|nr:zinc-binding dehydrogenase [Chitinophaga niastensis]PSL49896.1 NADPH:quinone reductase-like Zn-dependent oxidoreductase [Chitinophaga niastensis]
MKAILIKEKGNAENLIITEYPIPEPQPGFVLVRNKAFGINRAEIYMRKGEWGETHDIIGIEFAGIVENDPSGTIKKGQKVVSFVGGLARDFGGSYAEYISVPLQNIIPVETALPWDELAAIPETFATAWAVLNWGIEVKAGQSILVRGGTSTLGLALIILARQMGLTVIATSRSAEKHTLLKKYGADHVILDEGKIAEKIRRIIPKGVTSVAELIGTTTLTDSLACTQTNGTVCIAGFLGGLIPLENFMPLLQIPSSVKLTSFASAFTFGNMEFPYAEIPVQKIIFDIEQNKIPNILAKTFDFTQITAAHQLMESDNLNGKIVVKI